MKLNPKTYFCQPWTAVVLAFYSRQTDNHTSISSLSLGSYFQDQTKPARDCPNYTARNPVATAVFAAVMSKTVWATEQNNNCRI